MDPAACNFDPDAMMDDGSCLHDGLAFSLTILLDNFPWQTNWGLVDSTGVPVAFGGPYTDEGATVVENFCASNGCYTFTIFDTGGDGILGAGGYTLTLDTTIIASGSDSALNQSTEFCTENLNFGCTDSLACNYDSGAEFDNGTCFFSCFGCISETACNYSPEATVDDGSCLFDDACGVCGGDNGTCGGCTDSLACN